MLMRCLVSRRRVIESKRRFLCFKMPAFPAKRANSPTSLLWAFQLRRENTTLLHRIDAVEAANASLGDHTSILRKDKEETKNAHTTLAKDVTRLVVQVEQSATALRELQSRFEAIVKQVNSHEKGLETLGNEAGQVKDVPDQRLAELAGQVRQLEERADDSHRIAGDRAQGTHNVKSSRPART